MYEEESYYFANKKHWRVTAQAQHSFFVKKTVIRQIN
jgi:hypothetical protein